MCPFLVIRTRKLTKTHPACLFLQIRTCGVVLRVCVCLFLPNRTHLRQIFSTFVRFFTILSKAKGLESLDSSPFRLVRAGGVEPPRAYTHCHLKTARLPFRHARRQSINLHLIQNIAKSACRIVAEEHVSHFLRSDVRFGRIGQTGWAGQGARQVRRWKGHPKYNAPCRCGSAPRTVLVELRERLVAEFLEVAAVDRGADVV